MVNYSIHKLLFIGAAMLLSAPMQAQTVKEEPSASPYKFDWYLGVSGGFRMNKLKISDISTVNKSKMTGSPVFSFFMNGEFGWEKNFGIRPQISFLNRGGKLSDIPLSYKVTEGENETVRNVTASYQVNAHFIDFRVPLIFNFGYADWSLRPYAFVAPVLGITTGGNIKLQTRTAEGESVVYKTGISTANFKPLYFAGQIGCGAKYAIPINDTQLLIGLEVAYEHGFTDTYTKKEKNGESNNILPFYDTNTPTLGHRRLSGLEIQATVAIPLTLLAHKGRNDKSTPVEPLPVTQPPVTRQVVEEEKPCYTLDEIDALIAQNKPVVGKTICAIDDITFDFAKSTIKPSSYGYLNRLARTIIRTGKHIIVKGHTDNVGSNEVNMKLSSERAKTVLEYLVGQGVSRSKLTYDYYGSSRPISTNRTTDGRARNRRVEFTIYEK